MDMYFSNVEGGWVCVSRYWWCCLVSIVVLCINTIYSCFFTCKVNLFNFLEFFVVHIQTLDLQSWVVLVKEDIDLEIELLDTCLDPIDTSFLVKEDYCVTWVLSWIETDVGWLFVLLGVEKSRASPLTKWSHIISNEIGGCKCSTGIDEGESESSEIIEKVGTVTGLTLFWIGSWIGTTFAVRLDIVSSAT